jgi:asparagine synthase (glutamine-hydrolysing)
MCGIAALYNVSQLILDSEKAESVVRDMMDTLVHRGPDAEGLWADERGRCILGHRRLSIIDTSAAGRQPMSGTNGRWVVAFNGELYNFLELRHELEGKGVRFHSRTDTEVLIEAIALWGIDALAKLDGMFAFAAFDTVSGELIVARDAFGEKPLYYMELPGRGYVFASELQALEKVPGFDAEVSLDAMAEVLMFQYIGAPRTIFQSVKKLSPGHWMRLKPGQPPTTGRFFDFRPGAAGFDSRPLAALADELEDILLRSIKRRLISDVPLGAFLSGGVDSSTVCSLISKKMGLPLKTFSIGFRGAPESEHRAAREFARQVGSIHHDQVLSPDTTSFLSKIGRLLDEPNGDSSCLPTFLLSEFARQEVTVAVSGDGGDEMFLGYGRYFTTLEAEKTYKHSREWNPGKAYYSGGILVSNEMDIIELFGFVPDGLREHLGRVREELRNESVPLFCRLRKTDVENYLPGAILPKVDRMSMQHSLEVRTPYLNLDLARFAERLPLEALYHDRLGKLVLREVAYRYLPSKLVNAPKKGFGIPVSSWAKGALLKTASELLEAEDGRLLKALGRQAIERFLTRQRSTKGHVTYQIWSLVMLESWLRHHPSILDNISQKIDEMSRRNKKFNISFERKIIASRIDSETFRLDEEDPEKWLAKSAVVEAETRSETDYIVLPEWKHWNASILGRLSVFRGAKLVIASSELARKVDFSALRKFSSLGIQEIEYPLPYNGDRMFMRIRIRQKTPVQRLTAFLYLRLKAIATLSVKRRLMFILKAVTHALPHGGVLVLGYLRGGLADHAGDMAHRYLLFEGASQLPPIHFAHNDISEYGKGRYSICDGEIFFSPTRFRRLLTHMYWLIEQTPEIEPYLEYVTTFVSARSEDRT